MGKPRTIYKEYPQLVRMKYEVRIKFRKNFVRMEGDILIVGVMAKPEKGKANKEAIKKIADFFAVAPSRVRIAAGAKSKKKIVEIADL